MDHDAFIALTRFGLGPRPGERERLADPRGWLRAQVGARALPPSLAALPDTLQALAAFQARRGEADRAEVRAEARERYEREAAALLQWRVHSEAPFAERWYAHWANHFTVSVTRRVVTPLAGAFERDVVRRHAFGRFEDLLVASTRHPAMLLYLDNARSTGPRSATGLRTGAGLNENLAREVLELHTLGAGGGYTQADVEAFAAMLTGWTVPETADGTTFRFDPARHEPAPKTLLGTRYPAGDVDEGHAALGALSRHPSTARHVARRLCRHFLADLPPEAAVDRIAAVFRDTDGDLGAVARAVIDEPTAWAEPLVHVKRPSDLLTSMARLLGPAIDGDTLLRAQSSLGERPHAAPSPAGWSDLDADWAGPQAMLDRIELARRTAQRATVADPGALAVDVFGGVLSPATEKAIRTAPSAVDGLALLVASPAFQRR